MENFTLPDFNVPNTDLQELKGINANLASEFYKRIFAMIDNFEANLSEHEEVGVYLVSFGNAIQFHIEDIAYYNPSLINFIGRLDNGSRVELVQHVNQISFLLMALPKQEEHKPPRRIGFKSE